MKIDTIIFDLGNVLIDWSPSHLYDKIFPGEKEKMYFLHHICNMQWHSVQDAGRSPQEATEELVKQYPKLGAADTGFLQPMEGNV